MKPPVLLRVYKGDELQEVKQFDQDQIVIGRNADVQVELQDEAIAPLHAVIEERDSGYYISDLGSQTGTFKNGNKVLDESLATGDQISVGPYRIEFFVGLPKPATAPPGMADTPVPPSSNASPPPTPAATAASIPSEGRTPPPVGEAPAKVKKIVRPASRGTFAPASEIKDLNQILKPSKGTVLEVVVAWRERIMATHHFHEKQVVTIGSDPKNTISMPLVGLGKVSHPIVKLDSLAKVVVTQDMSGELVTESGSTPFHELSKQNKFAAGTDGLELTMNQGEMVRVGFQGDTISVYIRYVAETPKPLVAPLFDLTASEVTGVILATVVALIFGLYMMIYSVNPLDDESLLEEPIRKAVVTFKPPRPPSKPAKEPEQKPIPPKKKKVVKVTEKKKATPKRAQARKNDPGKKAPDVKPKVTKSKKKTLTSTRKGGAVKTSKKGGANAASQKPDPTKSGILGVFGSKGTQSKLDKTYSGSGELIGMADTATGEAGFNADREGDNLGSKLKDTGAGGKGSSTVGISGGVGTSGRGSGSYGYGTGGLGAKGNVDINVGGQEAEFSGSIDKEAIRRVILNNKRAIRSCYEAALNRNPNLYGKIVLEWDIEERGRVTRASIKSNTMSTRAVGDCIIRRLKTWRFPEPPPGQIGRVTYPFVFTSQ